MKILKTFLLSLFLLFTTLLAACGGGGGDGGADTPAPTTYSVIYNANGSTGGTVLSDAKAYAANSTATVLDNTGALVKTGYAFTGWNTAADGSGTAYAAGASVIIGAANITLYAAWAPAYSVRYDGNGYTGGVAPVDATAYLAGASATVLGNTGALVKVGGYVFTGWNTAVDGSGTAYAAGASLAIASADITLYAVWAPPHTVSYNGNGNLGGTAPVDATAYAAGTSATVLANTGAMVKAGDFFTGWNTAADGSGTAYAPGASITMGSADVTLYAVWAPHYTVSYSGNGNTGGTAPVDATAYAAGASTTVLGNTGALVKTGYDFTRWNTAADGSGTAYAASADITMDAANVTLYAVWVRQVQVTTLAGTAGSSGSADGSGTAARFRNPSGVTADGANLYVTDTMNSTIRKVVIATGVVTTLAGTAGTAGSADGTGTAALFYNPQGVATDGTNLYVTDFGNHTLRKVVIATGVVTTLAGTAGSSGSADGTGTAALFFNPQGIATDGTNLYVTDYGNHTLRKVVIATGVVTTLAGSARHPGSTDGTGAAARFWYPSGVATDGTNLYVADSNAGTIRKVVIATGVVTTLAGSSGFGSRDGTGAAARFYDSHGLATDGTNLYVADTDNHTIRNVVIATGVVTTLAGAANRSGTVDGTGTVARFQYPTGITIHGTNLYVTDYGNHTIRKIQ